MGLRERTPKGPFFELLTMNRNQFAEVPITWLYFSTLTLLSVATHCQTSHLARIFSQLNNGIWLNARFQACSSTSTPRWTRSSTRWCPRGSAAASATSSSTCSTGWCSCPAPAHTPSTRTAPPPGNSARRTGSRGEAGRNCSRIFNKKH